MNSSDELKGIENLSGRNQAVLSRAEAILKMSASFIEQTAMHSETDSHSSFVNDGEETYEEKAVSVATSDQTAGDRLKSDLENQPQTDTGVDLSAQNRGISTSVISESSRMSIAFFQSQCDALRRQLQNCQDSKIDCEQRLRQCAKSRDLLKLELEKSAKTVESIRQQRDAERRSTANMRQELKVTKSEAQELRTAARSQQRHTTEADSVRRRLRQRYDAARNEVAVLKAKLVSERNDHKQAVDDLKAEQRDLKSQVRRLERRSDELGAILRKHFEVVATQNALIENLRVRKDADNKVAELNSTVQSSLEFL